MVKLVATTVVRGSRHGESHGGVYLIDVEKQSVRRTVDWNKADIDWQGRGWDRGLRGIAIDGDVVYIATSDELVAFTPEFRAIGAWRSAYLKHCHEIAIHERTLYLASTAFDSVLGFNLDKQCFEWAMHVRSIGFKFKPVGFSPVSHEGPLMLDKLHINSLHCSATGMYITGSRAPGMLHFNGKDINLAVELPADTHNAQPFRDGVLFNDTADNVLRYTGRGDGHEDRAMTVPEFDDAALEHPELADPPIARARFARGLCVISDRIVAGGSSPATVSLYDLAANERLLSVSLTMDVRHAIHSLAVWPFD